MSLQKGANAPVPSGKLVIQARHKGPETDFSALLLTAAAKVRTDSDFVFFGNEQSPDGSVVYLSKRTADGGYIHELSVNLPAVPADVDKVAVTLTIDPTTKATFATVKELVIAVFEDKGSSREEVARCEPEGSSENAFIVIELYRRQGAWKVRHVAQGFNNGLAGIATAFGVDISDDGSGSTAAAPTPAAPTPPPPPPAPTISLTKPAPTGKVNLTKGNKIKIAKTRLITATGGWDNTWGKLDYDLYCHVAYKDGKTEVVNFDNLVSRNGKVRHQGDLRSGGAGTTERITVEMSDDIACVGFSFYSARENGAGSFAHAHARVSLDNGEGSEITLGVSQMSVDSNRYTLYFGTVLNGGPEDVEIVAHEDYSSRNSENQAVLYKDGRHKMDAGPENRYK